MIPFCQKCEVRYKGYVNDETRELFLQCPDCGNTLDNFDLTKLTVQDFVDFNEEPKEGI